MEGKKIFAVVFSAIFFVSSMTFAAEKKIESAWQPERKIGLFGGVTQVTLQMSEPCVMIDADTKKELQKIAKNKPFTVDFAALKSASIEIRGEQVGLKDLQSTINGKKYFGGVRVNKSKGSLTVINLVPVEEYLRGVLPEEMSPSFHEEALKAQAVAARTFTLKNLDRHKDSGYDLCSTTHCQAYEGAGSVYAQTDKAIRETRGEVVYSGGGAANTTFHTDSGGMTESAEAVWGTDVSYLQPVEELEKQTNHWTVKKTKAEFAEIIGASTFGSLKSIAMSRLVIGKSASDRSRSGRIKFALFAGTKKTVKMTGAEIRNKFSLPSTLCDIKLQNGEVIFDGYGRGHGVGMSQYGALAFAEKGWSYEKILRHYYKGTELKKLY